MEEKGLHNPPLFFWHTIPAASKRKRAIHDRDHAVHMQPSASLVIYLQFFYSVEWNYSNAIEPNVRKT